jgi:FkbM family methyltransferase
MHLDIEVADGESIQFECEDTIASAWVSRSILEGTTYPHLPFVSDVRVILDAGANCGAATVHLARHHPDAVVHSFEPGSRQRAYLQRNAAAYTNVKVHGLGLHSRAQTVPLYHGVDDSGMSSIVPGAFTTEAHEMIEVVAAGAWAEANGIDRIDILKIDVEGCEVDVIESLDALLPTVKVLYVEYDSRVARRSIDHLLADTHELYTGNMFLDQGEVVYISRALAADQAATEHLRRTFVGSET